MTSGMTSPRALTTAASLPAITPKLVATDLDGTIIPHGGTISQRTLDVFTELSARGIPLIIATGRPPRWVKPVIDATGHEGWIVSGNGGLTMDLSGDAPDIVQGMDGDTVRQIGALLREAAPGVAFGVETPRGFAVEAHFNDVRNTNPTEGMAPARAARQDLRVADSLEDLAHEDGIFKVVAATKDASPDLLAAAAHKVLDGLVTVTHSSVDLPIIEISALGVSKAKALDEIAAHLGISPADAVAFGDMPNDIEMLRWAGVGYAMTDAHPDALAAADAVAPPVESDGVAEVLERLLAASD